MSPPKFRVAICGGGVGGLVCAVALSRHADIQVDVYEAAAAFTEVGAGIGVWPRTWKVLCALGLREDLKRIAVVPPPSDEPQLAFHFRKGDQPEGINFYTLSTPGGMLAFHRADFHAVLLRHLGHTRGRHTGKRLLSYSQPRGGGSICLEFQDGTHATCDVLIGADGVKSAVRACLVEELAAAATTKDAEKVRAAGPPKWSGTVAYRALVPAETLRRRMPDHRVLREPMLYLGKNSEITVYPIQRGTMINLAAFRSRYEHEHSTFPGPWVQDVPASEVLREFDGWEPEVRVLLQSAERVNRWAIHTTLPLPSFVSGRVALVGDAAHAMMPYQGAGAGQSIEDAYILATLLGDRRTTHVTLARALRAYDVVRRPFAQRVQAASRENGLLYTLNFPGLGFDRPVRADAGQDGEKLKEIRARVRRNWEWAWTTTVDADVARAVRKLGEPLVGR